MVKARKLKVTAQRTRNTKTRKSQGRCKQTGWVRGADGYCKRGKSLAAKIMKEYRLRKSKSKSRH